MARENAEQLPDVLLLEGGEEVVSEDVFVGLVPRVRSSRHQGVVLQGYNC